MFVRPNPTGYSEIGDGSPQYFCKRIDRTIAVKLTKNITSFGVVRNLSILLDQRQGQWVHYRLNPNLPD